MKVIEKKSLTKSQWLAIILSSVFVLLLAASIVLSVIYAKLNEEEPATPPDIRTELGEALYAGSPIVYDRIEEANISYLIVKNEKGSFDLARWPDENGVFWLSYTDPDGGVEKMIPYLPPIVDAEGDFDYESLYAIENSDGYGKVYMLSYLCSAIGTPYFTERIDLPEDSETRARLLKEYGLAGEGIKPTTVSFLYEVLGDDGKPTGEKKPHKLTIGAPALNGDGHYFLVDDRECVYYSKYDFFKYAELGFESFIKGSLVAAGLPEDNSFEPLLTTDYKQWKNTMHTEGAVVAGSSVISKGNVLTPIKEGATYDPTRYPDGYLSMEEQDLKFDLSELRSHPDYERIAAALIGASVSARDEDDNPLPLSESILLTLISRPYETANMILSFGESESLSYTYTITAIEGILDYNDGSSTYETTAVGTAVGASKLLRVRYNYKIGSAAENANTIPRHAVIDLSSTLIPQEALSALLAASVGELATPISFSVSYTKDNSVKTVEKMVVSDIIGVYGPNGEIVDKADDSCYVMIKYYENINGVKGDKLPRTVALSEIKGDAKWAGLYNVLIGKGIGSNLELVAYSDTYYHELMSDYVTYEIDVISGYLTSEEIVSFRFVNMIERDPFYGESIYENITGGYGLYGVDADTCQNVLRILGGLSEDTTASLGLAGETVAVGLTNENMVKYNLYDYTIYFELPRSIYTEYIEVEGEEDTIEHYDWQYKLGFTLYVSKPDPVTGTRYVGSDMYDVIAKVSADTFVFLEYDFVDFWARRSMIMLDIKDVDDFKLEFSMEDVKGIYDFDISYETVYLKEGDPRVYYVKETAPEGSVEQKEFNIDVTQSGDYMTDTELNKFAERYGNNKVALGALYGSERLPNSAEWVGVSNFMLAFQILQMTGYEGTLTEEEQARASDANKLMSITLSLNARNAQPHDYVYEFYRIADRKIMVKTYLMDDDGSVVGGEDGCVSSFYISTASFKKMVNAYLTVFNAGTVDGEIPYVDEK